MVRVLSVTSDAGEPATPEPPMSFGTRLRQLRLKKGVTQRDLADDLNSRLRRQGDRGLTVSYLSKIETGRFGPPSDAVIAQLTEVLEAGPDELFCLAGRLPLNMAEKLGKNHAARTFFMFAIDRLIERDWQGLLSQIQNGASGKGRK